MTAKIKVKKLRLCFWLPAFAAVGIIVSCAKRELNKNGFKLQKSRKLKKNILRAIKSVKKRDKKTELINVVTHDGVKVKITL